MPTLNVSLTDTLDRFVQERVADGTYTDESEVVREALRLLQEADALEAAKGEALRREVALGIDDADHSRFSARSLDEIADAVLEESESPSR